MPWPTLNTYVTEPQISFFFFCTNKIPKDTPLKSINILDIISYKVHYIVNIMHSLIRKIILIPFFYPILVYPMHFMYIKGILQN